MNADTTATATATTITIGSKVFKTRKGAQNEADRSLDYAAQGGCNVDIIKHDGGFVVVYLEPCTPERARVLLASGQVLDAVIAG